MATPESTSPYANPDIATWMGSFEGVPDAVWPAPVESSVEQAARGSWQNSLHQRFDALGVLLPGLGLAFLLALAGNALADLIGVRLLSFERSPVSAIFIVVVLGLALRNTIGLPKVYGRGLNLCLKGLLRIGIVLLGIRLSLLQAGHIGLLAAPVVVGCILCALLLVTWIGRAMKLPRRLTSLIAVGTSICGVSAIAATGPAIDAEEDEISYAVATVALFGMLALVLHPFIAHWIFPDEPHLAGIFLGTAVHDTAQVAGSALIYEQQYAAPDALEFAVVTKLIRNLFMVVVIPGMAVLYHRNSGAQGKAPGLSKLVPLFVFGFLAMMIFRSVGDLGDRAFGFLDPASWQNVIHVLRTAADWCLVLAMAAVGLGTSVSKLRTLGIKAFLCGFLAAALVGVTSVLLIRLVAALAAG